MIDLLAGLVLPNQVGHQDPKVVQGRVAHIDADFMAYIIACDTIAETSGEKPLRDLGYKYGQVKEFADFITRKAGASSYVLHVTPTGSNKGNRPAQAVQQEYQANRAGKEPPVDLAAVRSYMVNECSSIGHMNQEADDGLAQANYNDPNAVLCSADKDLRMVPGLHMDMNTYELIDVPHGEYGHIEIDDTKSAKKLVGYGPAFFFAQCVMGDTADNIKGLPLLSAKEAMRVKPTAVFLKDVEKYKAAKDGQMKEFAADRVKSHLVKAKQCGAVTTYELLKDITNVKDAFHYVRKLFNDLAQDHDYAFEHWSTGAAVTPNAALLGDMRLLWMRRNTNEDDVLAFLKENV